MASCLEDNPIDTNANVTSRRKRQFANEASTSAQVQGEEAPTRNQVFKSSKRRRESPESSDSDRVSTISHSDSVIFISDSSSTSASEEAPSVGQLRSDEEYAIKLQQEFESSYRARVNNEKKDLEIAKRIHRLEQRQSLVNIRINQMNKRNPQPQVPQLSTINNEPLDHIQPESSFIRTNYANRATEEEVAALRQQTTTVIGQRLQFRTNIAPPGLHCNINIPNISSISNSRMLLAPSSLAEQQEIRTLISAASMIRLSQSSSTNKQDLFKYLASYEYSVKKSDDSTVESECSICLDVYENKCLVTHLACMHKFHTNCIKTWLNNSVVCPICKKHAVKGQ